MKNSDSIVDRRIVTLVYVVTPDDDVLLIRRTKQPNAGLLSPPGGKVEGDESPKECAIRELKEESGLIADPDDTVLIGLVTEIGYDKPGDQWIMFLYRVRTWSGTLTRQSPEGELDFYPLAGVHELSVPETDRKIIWPLFRSGAFFDIKIDCRDS